ncbi:MAG: Flp pilus assembly protein CpaB [Chloroflexota bacterium]
MKGSSRKSLLLAFLLAALAAAAVYFLLAGRGGKQAVEELPGDKVETVPVVVAARDVPADTALTAADIEVRQIPAEGRHPDAVSDPAVAEGRVTRADLLLGEQVLAPRLLDPADAVPRTFAREVPPGYRAISLDGDEVRIVGGLVQPGDHVDVVGYFEFEESGNAAGGAPPPTPTPEGAEPVINQPEATTSPGSAKAAAAFYLLQDLEVLSVAQALDPGDPGMSADGAPAEAAAEAAKGVAGGADDPVARPGAGSITLLVPAGDVARLLLAVNTVPSDGALRLVLRSPGDTGRSVQPPVVTRGEEAQYQFGGVVAPVSANPLLVVAAEFAETALLTGQDLEFTVTVKNVSGEPVYPGVGGAPDGFTYAERAAWDSEGFFEDDGNLRIGLNVAGAAQPFPWRWTLTDPLEPGQEATITGAVTLERPTTGKRYWFGIIRERDEVLADGVGVAEIRVDQPSLVRVMVDGAALRGEPDAGAPVVAEAPLDADLPVTDQRPGWFRVVSPGGEGWIEAASVEPVTPAEPAAADAGSGAPPAAATPVASGE